MVRKWLQEYTGALVLVSHDRKFLDSIINRTIELSFLVLMIIKLTIVSI